MSETQPYARYEHYSDCDGNDPKCAACCENGIGMDLETRANNLRVWMKKYPYRDDPIMIEAKILEQFREVEKDAKPLRDALEICHNILEGMFDAAVRNGMDTKKAMYLEIFYAVEKAKTALGKNPEGYSPVAVAKLKKQTGHSLMDCSKVLLITGDFDQALQVLQARRPEGS